VEAIAATAETWEWESMIFRGSRAKPADRSQEMAMRKEDRGHEIATNQEDGVAVGTSVWGGRG